MKKKDVYRFTRSDGGITVSKVKPDGEYTVLSRLVADSGKMLTNAADAALVPMTDTQTPEDWSEVDYPEEQLI